jgi:hypothetical protein
MSTLEFTQETTLEPEAFKRLLQTASEQYDPVEELLNLERQLLEMEQKHNLASPEFYRLYQAGEMGDDIAFVTWAGRYRLFMSLKKAISESLKLVLTEPASVPA